MSNTVFVYKSKRNQDLYLYVPKEGDFSHVPDKLLEKFGEIIFVLSFDIDKRNNLGREDPEIVKRNLKKQGYHLQLPELVMPVNPSLKSTHETQPKKH